MYCTTCGVEMSEQVRFCSKCGSPSGAQQDAAPAFTPEPRALRLYKARKKIAGVCAGVARYLDVDPVLVRVLWVAFTFCGGAGFLAYVLALIIIPSDLDFADQPIQRSSASV